MFSTLFGLLNRTRAAGSVNADAQRAPAGPGASSYDLTGLNAGAPSLTEKVKKTKDLHSTQETQQ
ncbi:hypothetical protein BISA_1895 [Bifidobacterium saguini DSM 23967]|uniref:Uncharacterized protein n=1 Tax=Bifidobacterium saguini DSM 23967 TaxID=1437607 RepID=A0A087D6Z0_9BIFI|nr:hypothetical protein BISA_1895 [Bifidobacterium saguini DSM 23967]